MAIQIIPAIALVVERLTVFQRTALWVVLARQAHIAPLNYLPHRATFECIGSTLADHTEPFGSSRSRALQRPQPPTGQVRFKGQ